MTMRKLGGPITIHTHGSCTINPGPGGWAVLIEKGHKAKEMSGGVSKSTSNRMTLIAAIMALEALKNPCKVTLYTNNDYVCKAMTSWMHNWKNNGWKASDGRKVKNDDLWLRLDVLAATHEVDWLRTTTQSGKQRNERMSKLARQAAYRYSE